MWSVMSWNAQLEDLITQRYFFNHRNTTLYLYTEPIRTPSKCRQYKQFVDKQTRRKSIKSPTGQIAD